MEKEEMNREIRRGREREEVGKMWERNDEDGGNGGRKGGAGERKRDEASVESDC